jgi:hypothetical protein
VIIIVPCLIIGKGNDAGSRSSGHNAGGSSHGGASNKASDRERTKSGHGRSAESTSTGKQSAREPPPCLSTKKCAGEKHYLSDFSHTGKDEAMTLLSEYKKKRDSYKGFTIFRTYPLNTERSSRGSLAYRSRENVSLLC